MAGSDGFVRTQSFARRRRRPRPTASRSTSPSSTRPTARSPATATASRTAQPYTADGPVAFAAGKAVVVVRPAARAGRRQQDARGRIVAGPALRPRAVARRGRRVGRAPATSSPKPRSTRALSPSTRASARRCRSSRTRPSAERTAAARRASRRRSTRSSPQPPGATRLLAPRRRRPSPARWSRPAASPALPGRRRLRPAAGRARGRAPPKLAEWITRPDNPLFARVIVNRLWHYHFGAGLVETPNDFGFNGGRPIHPELLDWLAAEFDREQGYSLEGAAPADRHVGDLPAVVAPREATRSAIDADNRLLWRHAAAAAGSRGGARRDARRRAASSTARSAARASAITSDTDFNGTHVLRPDRPGRPEFHRRSIYRFVPRGAQPGPARRVRLPRPVDRRPAPRRDHDAAAGPGAVEQRLRPAHGRRASRTASSKERDDVDRQVGAAYRSWRSSATADGRRSATLARAAGRRRTGWRRSAGRCSTATNS